MSTSAHLNEVLDYLLAANAIRLSEGKTVLEHGLECATFGLESNYSTELIVAALIHDVGHVYLTDATHYEQDVYHADVAATWARRYFVESVCEPIRLHVDAKRYLCTKDPTYLERLGQYSNMSLFVQGALMSKKELEDFEKQQYFMDALQLRRADDSGCVENRLTLDNCIDYISSVML